MNKIQRTSKFFKWFFKIIFILMPILYIIFWSNILTPESHFASGHGISFNFVPREMGAHIIHPLSVDTRLLGFLISLIPLTINLLVLGFLISLFKGFERGEIFSLQNVRLIKKIGFTILAGQLVHPIYEFLISMTLTWHNPPGHRVAMISFNNTNAGFLLTALLIILISWIMQEACKLKEEQDYII